MFHTSSQKKIVLSFLQYEAKSFRFLSLLNFIRDTLATEKSVWYVPSMDDSRILKLFKDNGAYLEGHFQLSSGLHSPNYMQSAKVLQHPPLAAEMGTALAAKLREIPDLVLSPALGGIIIGHEVARALGVRFLFCEREENVFRLRRGFEIHAVEKVVVIEDVVTTGRSTKETIAVAEEAGGRIIGVGCIVNRSNEDPKFPGSFEYLLRLPLTNHNPSDCPLCKQNIPLVKPGSRKF
jgi:orotate phosphoribosyltransferase